MKKIIFAATLAGAALLTSCGGGNGKVQMGSLSEFDSLSYALGANMGFGISYEMKDIPFDYAVVTKAIEEGALNKASQKHDESLEMTPASDDRIDAITGARILWKLCGLTLRSHAENPQR